ncbi:hypothetical protein AB3504_00265 [Acinetobacter baumannii]
MIRCNCCRTSNSSFTN